ncbi:MAG: hypothetical protein U5K76_02935 [Woeseiaceae bacterium]|nr:hypothetical protein [Woeseiaceae bacterium]
MFFVGADELLADLLRKRPAARLRDDRVQVAIQLPVFQLRERTEQRLAIQRAIEILLQLVRVEAIGELAKRDDHRFQQCILVEPEVAAHLAHAVQRPEVFAFLADQQLLHRIVAVLGEFQRVVVTRQHRRLVQPEHAFQAGPDGGAPRQQQPAGSFADARRFDSCWQGRRILRPSDGVREVCADLQGSTGQLPGVDDPSQGFTRSLDPDNCRGSSGSRSWQLYRGLYTQWAGGRLRQQAREELVPAPTTRRRGATEGTARAR